MYVKSADMSMKAKTCPMISSALCVSTAFPISKESNNLFVSQQSLSHSEALFFCTTKKDAAFSPHPSSDFLFRFLFSTDRAGCSIHKLQWVLLPLPVRKQPQVRLCGQDISTDHPDLCAGIPMRYGVLPA